MTARSPNWDGDIGEWKDVINAHIEAVPWAGHAQSRLAPSKYAKLTRLDGHPDWQSICCSSMSTCVNRLEMGRATWEPVTQLLNVR